MALSISRSTCGFNRSDPMDLYGSSSVMQFLTKSLSTDGHFSFLEPCLEDVVCGKGREDVEYLPVSVVTKSPTLFSNCPMFSSFSLSLLM